MKYMGSKKHMLKNGLGEMIIDQAKKANNFIDPFCGSAAVVWFAADQINNKILAGDLQQYAVCLANSVINRTTTMEMVPLFKWIEDAKSFYIRNPIKITKNDPFEYVEASRQFCGNNRRSGTILKAYGGYYFSPEQAKKFDILLNCLPEERNLANMGKSALIMAATSCVASPGHTAQPFQPTVNAIKYIMEAWNKDPFIYVEKALMEINTHYSKTKGKAIVGNAESLINNAEEGDLIFIDPPYSGVHYSRFYHVLETIAKNESIQVSGNGRYPGVENRPRSDFSMRTSSLKAFESLLQKISDKKASAIITFPASECSNGLSGEIVKEISKKHFKVKKDVVEGTFSTLGGNSINRPARQTSAELVLLLEPK